ncbi:MAG TPA: hypothetical protein DDW20_03685 [Firmicutes bacterium]|nr:hypothetical protein [Bacillota bacterium]
MGLFDKFKTKLGGKNYLNGFSCPLCGDRVYKTGIEQYSCESCGNLTGDAYYLALRYDLQQQRIDDYSIDVYIKRMKDNKQKECDQKEFLDNYRKNLEEEAILHGDTRSISKYHWLDYVDTIVLGFYNTKSISKYRFPNGRFLLTMYPKDTDPKEFYRFFVSNKAGDNIGECDVYVSIDITGKEFYVDKDKTTKDALYIVARDVKAEVNQKGLHYLVKDNPHLYATKYGDIYDALNHFADEALARFRQEIIDEIYKGLKSAKRNYYGFDDITFSKIYFEQ